jgi:hypothetical protein
MAHAKLSPSSAERWMTCPASVVLSAQFPEDRSSSFAAEGTAAHELAERSLTNGVDPSVYVGDVIHADGFDFTVDADMAENVAVYVNFVRGLDTPGLEALSEYEVKLDISGITGEEGAEGTSDSVVLVGNTLCVVDLKYGRGLKVYAAENPQLAIYALAALDRYSLTHDIESVRLAIVQPRLDHIDVWDAPLAWLEDFRGRVETAAGRVALAEDLTDDSEPLGALVQPSEKGCVFCPAKGSCRALAEHAARSISADFADLDNVTPEAVKQASAAILTGEDIARLLPCLDMIENWCSAVRATATKTLTNGGDIPGYKLVEGRAGARKWGDPAAAEIYLRKTLRLKTEDAYERSLISPTTAEKLAKAGKIKPRGWEKLQDNIVRSAGKPSIAPTTDKRPAIAGITSADFE